MVLVFVVDPQVCHQIMVPCKHLVTQRTLIGPLTSMLLQQILIIRVNVVNI